MGSSRVDVSGQSCPLPVIRARLAMDELGPGDVLELISTDRGSLSDVPAWAESLGHRLVHVADDGGRFEFHIEKAG